MKNTQKGFVTPLLIAFVALAAVSSAYLYYNSNPSIHTTTSLQAVSINTTVQKQAALNNQVQPPSPNVIGVSPSIGASGTTVTIVGSKFGNNVDVSFTSVAGQIGNSLHVKSNSISSTTINFVIPTGSPAGAYTVSAANIMNNISASNGTYALFTVKGGSTTVTPKKGVNTGMADDVAIMAELRTLRTDAEEYNINNLDLGYTGLCTSTKNSNGFGWIKLAAKDVGGSKGIMCKANQSAYVVAVALNSGAYGCVDSQAHLKDNLAAFPSDMECSGATFKPAPVSTTKSAVTTHAPSGSPISFDATVVGGTLSVTDRNAIITSLMNAVAILNSGDVAAFRQYEAKTLPPEALVQLNAMPDSQLAAAMKSAAKIASHDTTIANLSSADATWTILDSDHVEIKIQLGANVRSVLDAVRINGVWY